MKIILRIIIWVVIAIAAVGYLAISQVVRLGINRNASFAFIYKSDKNVSEGWNKHTDTIKAGQEWMRSMPTEDLTIKSYDELKLVSHLIKHDEKPKGVVILAHGYRGVYTQDFAGISKDMYDAGFDLLMIEERAHGESEGDYICFGQQACKDVAQWAWLMAEKYGPKMPLFLYGISMGASTVMLTLGEELPETVKGEISDCGYTSPEAIIKHMLKEVFHMPVFPVYEVANHIFNSKTGGNFNVSTVPILQKSTLPMLFIHGADDGFVYTDMGRENYAACAASDKEILIVEGANHGQSYLTEPELVRSKVLDFLERNIMLK